MPNVAHVAAGPLYSAFPRGLLPPKGRGVVASQTIPENKFVVKYAGRLMTTMEGQQWEAEMEAEGNPTSFLFFHENDCIDATEETAGSGASSTIPEAPSTSRLWP